jgi:2',3'-cyclic-nucleotide 2'-phosphodiesterase (5'-nucleotidase family)
LFSEEGKSIVTKSKTSARKIGAISLSVVFPALFICLWSVAVPAQQPAPSAPATREINTRASEKLIDASINDDPSVDQMLATYSPKVRALDNVIGTLRGELRKGGMGAGSLGNFVSDAIRVEAAQKLKRPIDLAVVNGGGLRRSVIPEGELRTRDIFELLPFENALVALDLTGEQLLTLLANITSVRDAQSGARITYKTDADRKNELESARLFDEQYHDLPINPKTTYTIVTIDYLINRGSTTYAVLGGARNVRPLGITLRDAVMDYVKAETSAGRPIRMNLDGRFILDKAAAPQPPTK